MNNRFYGAQNYPQADRHLQYIVADLSTAKAHGDGSNVLDLDDPDIFLHPLIYMIYALTH